MRPYLFAIILSLFVVLFSSLTYGEENLNNNTNSNQNIGNKFTNKILDYSFEPFLSLNDKDYQDLPHNKTLSLRTFAIAAWIKTTADQSSSSNFLEEPAHLVNKGGFNSDEKGENMNYGIWFSTNGTISGGFENELGEDFEVKTTKKYNDGKWHYILLSYDGFSLRLYIDGEQLSTKLTNGAIPDYSGEQPLRIGANSLDESKFFTGHIDEVRVWNRGLTSEEISQIYINNSFNPQGQIVYLNFGEGIVNSHYQDKPLNFPDNSSTEEIGDNKKEMKRTIPSNNITNTNNIFNIAVTADWGCEEDTEKTIQNIQSKNPELVLGVGDYSYSKSADCWFDIIHPLKSKMKIAMGDHEYDETEGGTIGIINQYLKPLNLQKTYYSFDMNNVHVTIVDPYIDYKSSSPQYQFIENDLKTASTNPKIDWMFVAETIPIYTSTAQHPANSTIRDIYHPLFDKYGVDIVFTSDNHNYQRTLPLKYNNVGGSSDNPTITDSNPNNYYNNGNGGVIYLITGTGGRSLYEIEQQAPFVAKQDDKHFGFLNIDINNKTLKGTFYANESELPQYYYVSYQNNIIDQFTISKINDSKYEFDKF